MTAHNGGQCRRGAGPVPRRPRGAFSGPQASSGWAPSARTLRRLPALPRAVTPPRRPAPPTTAPAVCFQPAGTRGPPPWLALRSRASPHRLLQDGAEQAPGPALTDAALAAPSLTPASFTSAQRVPPADKARLVASRSQLPERSYFTHTPPAAVAVPRTLGKEELRRPRPDPRG